MKVLISHPTLNENSKGVVNGLLKVKLLYKLFTSVAIFPNQFLFSFLKINLLKDFKKRLLSKSWESHTKTMPFYELGRLLASKLKLSWLTVHEDGLFCIDRVYHKQDAWIARHIKKVGKNKLKGIYAYEDGALESFKQAKALGLTCYYDLPIGYWKSARLLLSDELKKNPGWASTLTGFKDSDKKLARKDSELSLADHIFVASSFTKKTLELFDDGLAPVKVIPYGFPQVIKNKTYTPLQGRKLKALFVGGLSQRKGISYMFKSLEGLESQISLTVVGHKADPNSEALNNALAKHTYIPALTHGEVLKCMQSHDVLLFPSLFEGFGLVITEAMSQGIPVITTDRTAGPDLITHGKNGWLVAPASSKAIRKVLQQILENQSLIKTVGQAALEKAKTRPWSVYENEMAKALQII